jgi:hypothetical protein
MPLSIMCTAVTYDNSKQSGCDAGLWSRSRWCVNHCAEAVKLTYAEKQRDFGPVLWPGIGYRESLNFFAQALRNAHGLDLINMPQQ